jgi:hypothetical protein
VGGLSESGGGWARCSGSKFLNLRAELWWGLRVRFEKAYEFREKGVKHPE